MSPILPVPPEIIPPDYAATGRPEPARRSCLKRPEEIEPMRRACAAAREVLDTVLDAVDVGITTDELDKIAHAKTIELGGYPSDLNYNGFTKSICTSVNEVICHGIPDDRALRNGDIINCDVSIYIHGMHGDCSETVFVGEVDDTSKRLVQATWESMMSAIEVCAPGVPLNAIGRAIEQVAGRYGFSVVRDFTGHGIGESFHMAPTILHYYDRRMNQPMEENMTFTIEPMINVGAPGCKVWDDNWTAVTTDLERSAQFEHTILITANGSEILTGQDPPWFRRS